MSLATHIDIPRGAANFKIFADVVKNVPTESFQMTTPDGGAAFNYAIRVPKGVIAVVAPWNLPLLLMTWKVGPALACGNTVVVKPSEETPSTATLLGEVMNKVGVPQGRLQRRARLRPQFGRRIPDPPSRRQRHHLHRRDAHRHRDHEGGGGEDARGLDGARRQERRPGVRRRDFDAAVDGIARASFANTGQICLGTERVYVERPIFDKFVPALQGQGAKA